MKNSRLSFAIFLLANFLLLLTAQTASTQDVMKVASDSHRVLLENDQVRVLSVTLKAGQKAPMHSHPASVVYFLSDGRLKFTFSDGKTLIREVKHGNALWSEPVTHEAENVGTTEFTELQIEMKQPVATKTNKM
jgi:quercetin dioxygenase-like cupin family protein